MLWPLSVVIVANTNGRLAIPALAGLLVLLVETEMFSRSDFVLLTAPLMIVGLHLNCCFLPYLRLL